MEEFLFLVDLIDFYDINYRINEKKNTKLYWSQPFINGIIFQNLSERLSRYLEIL